MDWLYIENWKKEIAEQAKLGSCNPNKIFDTLENLNQRHDDIHRFIMREADIQLRQDLCPPDSFSYCWVEMGSGGREERTLWTDQDNGIIYQCEEQDEEIALQFLSQLSEKVVGELAKAGYPLCNGNVMATNLRWRQSLDGWKKNISGWCANLTLDHIRFLLIAADLRPMYGEMKLAAEVREWISNSIIPMSVLQRIAQYSFHYDLPIGLFGRVFTNAHGEQAGLLSIKEGGYYQLVSMIRVLSFWSGFKSSSPSTRSRIHSLSTALKNQAEWESALAFFLHLRLKNHVSCFFNGVGIADFLDLRQLPKEYVGFLKEHLQFLKEQQKHWVKVLEKKGWDFGQLF